ncbi:hypothetical protein [Streptomyces sp. NBC_00582]|uniref:hypothetical protein n=1 Tax=Streptomyces sp. NBC_00582 TaxID=2975783 RepID=UPI0010625D30|nr:hypothetical protein [Streptomyces sp. NBC_00582]WUB64984.1 hypothetical protein OG852_33555 [Streptomyces sp. NBC_00582]
MILLVLSGILVLTVGGCACVWWAARGGPRWTRAVATATLAAGELARRADIRSNATGQNTSNDG